MMHMFQPRLAFQSLQDQEIYQVSALRTTLRYLHDHSPFYQRLFKAGQFDINKISTLQHLQDLPTTSKADMQDHNLEFLCVPYSEVKEFTATSGTMGKPVTIALTENDLQRLAYNEQQSFTCADATPQDIFQLMLTLDRQFMAGMAYYSGIRKIGAALVRTGPGLPQMQWDTISRLNCNSLVAVPSFLVKMISWANEYGINLGSTAVQKAICIGESLRYPDGRLNVLGEKITQNWPIKLYGTYAATEMQTAFTDCSAGMGGHHQPDLIIIEILDDEGRQLPDGTPGEIVITTLGIEGMPLLRYRTGDMAILYAEPCSCGRHSKRLSHVTGRKQQMIKYKGTTLYPPAIFDMLNEVSYVQEYVVEVFSNELGTDELKLHLHTPLNADDCERKLKPLLQSRLRVVPALQFHSGTDMQAMQFPQSSRKQVRFIDNRPSLQS
jgi:phenylacetate-CoA ligase